MASAFETATDIFGPWTLAIFALIPIALGVIGFYIYRVGLPNVSLGSIVDGLSGGSGSRKPRGDGPIFGAQWRLMIVLVMIAIGVYGYIFLYTRRFGRGPWPFGPWVGYTLFGFPAYWGAFVICFVVTVVGLPLYVYFVPFGGGTTGRALWIISSLCMGGTLFDRGADGQYHARPLRIGPPPSSDPEPIYYLTPDEDDPGDGEEYYEYQEDPIPEIDYSKSAFGFMKGAWWELRGPIEFASRMAFKPVAYTWEKTGPALEDIEAKDPGMSRVEWMLAEGGYDEETLRDHGRRILSENGHEEQAIAADGSGYEFDPIWVLERDYNVLDRVGHTFRAFNPFPAGASPGHLLIDTKRLWIKLQGSGGIHLIEKAKERALVEAAYKSRVSQAFTFGMVFFALLMGVGTAFLTSG